MEIALLSPWIFLLFVGIFDAGFYCYAAISTANAARVAATYTSDGLSLGDSSLACAAALEEMRQLPNIKNSVNSCNALPLIVAAKQINVGPDGGPATEVTVQYQTVNLFVIPGLPGQMTLKRTVQMKQRL